MSIRQNILIRISAIMAVLCLPSTLAAQAERVFSDTTHIVLADSLYSLTAKELQQLPQPLQPLVNDSTTTSQSLTRRQQRQQRLATFTPDPAKATWSALVFPGGGQIYNHKYWKLPIVYGGFLGCAYALNWNNQMYSDYRQAFLDIMDADPNTKSYEGFFPSGYDFQNNEEYMKNLFKKRKDRYRRWRDLSVFACVGVYLISIVDAYVDAHLSSFDISDEINLSIQPDIMPDINSGAGHYGLNCNITF